MNEKNQVVRHDEPNEPNRFRDSGPGSQLNRNTKRATSSRRKPGSMERDFTRSRSGLMKAMCFASCTLRGCCDEKVQGSGQRPSARVDSFCPQSYPMILLDELHDSPAFRAQNLFNRSGRLSHSAHWIVCSRSAFKCLVPPGTPPAGLSSVPQRLFKH